MVFFSARSFKGGYKSWEQDNLSQLFWIHNSIHLRIIGDIILFYTALHMGEKMWYLMLFKKYLLNWSYPYVLLNTMYMIEFVSSFMVIQWMQSLFVLTVPISTGINAAVRYNLYKKSSKKAKVNHPVIYKRIKQNLHNKV